MMNFGQIWTFVIFKGQYFAPKRVKSGKKVPMGKNNLKLSATTILSQ